LDADDLSDRIRATARQTRAAVVAVAGFSLDLAVFIGRLDGLACWERGQSGVERRGE
jgi:hypothetical protein